MAENFVRIQAQPLRTFVFQLFSKAGMKPADAEFQADALVQMDLWGIPSQGVIRVPIYVKRIRSGAINPQPQIKTIRKAEGLEVIDGDNGSGFIVGRSAMGRAITIAESRNVAAVGATRSNHFGAAGLYARMAAERGMIGICTTNGVQNMVAPGSAKPVVGDNPLAIAAPTFGDFPFVIDISTSAAAAGSLMAAADTKKKIPLDWATDREGCPTDDPEVAIAGGFLLPIAGYKGFGLALALDILCGVMTGGAFLNEMRGMYNFPDKPSLTGHFMIALNPLSIMSRKEFKDRMTEFCRILKSTPMRDGQKEMLIPGELEYRTALDREKSGIPLPASLYAELSGMGKREGVEVELSM
ncbi:MAG: Ldh family oxidoreductase [Desulfobacteraceae bacterium]|nr:MAG: Ldh family oxidoreductase [Desulfobacteraceae bacterium]